MADGISLFAQRHRGKSIILGCDYITFSALIDKGNINGLLSLNDCYYA